MNYRGNRGEKRETKNETKAFSLVILSAGKMEMSWICDGEASENFSFGVGRKWKVSFKYISCVIPVRNPSRDVKWALGYIIFRGVVQGSVLFFKTLGYRCGDSI